jgi:hypothetical protein
VELSLWMIRSELRHLVAQLAIDSEVSPEDAQKRLKPLVDRENRFELKRLSILKKRAEEQLVKIEGQIEDRRSASPAAVEKSLKSWSGQVRRQQQRAKLASKQRTKKSAEDSGASK